MKSPYRSFIFPGICAILGLIVVLVFATGQIRFFRIPTGGMSPTVAPGDYVFASKSGRSSEEFERGDIVIFAPPLDPKSRYIQRIVALPGDRIELFDAHLAVNGELLRSPEGKPSSPAKHPVPNTTPPSYPLTIPTDHVFVIGDNYDNSLDSRYFGPIPVDSITHIPRRIVLPLNRSGSLSTDDDGS